MKPLQHIAFDPSRLRGYTEQRLDDFPWISTMLIVGLTLIALGVL